MPTNQLLFTSWVAPVVRIGFHLVVIILLMGFFEIITRRLMMASFSLGSGFSMIRSFH